MGATVLLPRREGADRAAERVFLGWARAALASAAAHLAEHYARGDELRLDEATVVLPGARAGRRLKELLLDEAERRRLRLRPPQVATLGALPELLYRAELPLAGDALARRAWAQALRALAHPRLARLFPAAPAAGEARGWARLARTAQALHREVAGAGLRFAEVAGRCREGLLFDDGERWQVLAEAQAVYAGALSALGLADRDLARIDALASGRLGSARELWLLGIAEMPSVLRRMLEALPPATPLRALVHAPADEAHGFDALGCIRPEAWAERALPLVDEQVVVCARPAEQAQAVVRALAGLGGRYAAEEIVIAVPDPEVTPCLAQQLEAAGVPTHLAEGTPAERSPVARLLAALADYLDGGRFPAAAALLRHPDLGRWLRRAAQAAGVPALTQEDGWLAPLDACFSARLPSRLEGAGGAGRPELEAVEALGRVLADGLLQRLRGERPLSEWMDRLVALLVEVYGHEPLHRSDPAERRVLEACRCVRAVAAELHHLPPALDERCSAATALRLLLDELRGATLAPDADHAAVELLGWLELRLDDAPVALVTGFNEPFLPESLSAHAFLPNALRARLGLADNAHRYARDAYELTALLRSREHVRLFAGRRSATGDPLRPSRLLFAVEGRALAERVRRFFADEADAAAPADSPAADALAGASCFRLPTTRVLSAPAPRACLRVTDFKGLLADPYAWALQHVLQLAALDDRARELDGLRFGGLAHEVLERFARLDEAHATDAERVRHALDLLLDDLVRERFGAEPLPAVRLQVEQLRARLAGFARWQAGWVAEGWRTVGVECATPEDGAPFLVDGAAFRLHGRIDRIDHHAGRGEWALFDYKTGDRGEPPEDTHRAGRGGERRWVDLQLPLYRHLLSHVRDAAGRAPCPEPPERVRLGYVVLPCEVERAGAAFADWTPDELVEADECARDAVRLVRENAFRYDAARAAGYRDTPLAALLGVGYLESAAAQEDDQ